VAAHLVDHAGPHWDHGLMIVEQLQLQALCVLPQVFGPQLRVLGPQLRVLGFQLGVPGLKNCAALLVGVLILCALLAQLTFLWAAIIARD
jgi:hypothetical protein